MKKFLKLKLLYIYIDLLFKSLMVCLVVVSMLLNIDRKSFTLMAVRSNQCQKLESEENSDKLRFSEFSIFILTWKK